MAALSLQKIDKRFGDHQVLRQVDLEVEPGAIHFILGRSGAGKSQLIKGVVGLSPFDAGEVTCFGERLDGTAAARRRLGQHCQLVFQSSALFDQLTVLQNVAMPLQQRDRLRPAAARQRALEALEQVQAADLAPRSILELGAGSQKRVAIARALALQPRLLLYDEPTTSLDPVAARRTDRLMQRLRAAGTCTQVVVSHDLQSTAAVATWVSFLHAGAMVYHGPAAAFLAATEDPIIGPFLRRRQLA